MNKEIIKKLYPDAYEYMENGQCSTCGVPIDSQLFRDELSVKEFRISGMCMACQLKTFGKCDHEWVFIGKRNANVSDTYSQHFGIYNEYHCKRCLEVKIK